MINKTDYRMLSLMLEKISRLFKIVSEHSKEEIRTTFILTDAIEYEFEKLYEDSTRLSLDLIMAYGERLHIDDLRSIRNRVAHEYEKVSLSILFDTIEKDLPKLKCDIESLIKEL